MLKPRTRATAQAEGLNTIAGLEARVLHEPFNQFHLIVRRYILTCFNLALQERVARLFATRLVRLGFWWLGRAEVLSRPPDGPAPADIDAANRTYRRIG